MQKHRHGILQPTADTAFLLVHGYHSRFKNFNNFDEYFSYSEKKSEGSPKAQIKTDNQNVLIAMHLNLE